MRKIILILWLIVPILNLEFELIVESPEDLVQIIKSACTSARNLKTIAEANKINLQDKVEQNTKLKMNCEPTQYAKYIIAKQQAQALLTTTQYTTKQSITEQITTIKPTTTQPVKKQQNVQYNLFIMPIKKKPFKVLPTTTPTSTKPTTTPTQTNPKIDEYVAESRKLVEFKDHVENSIGYLDKLTPANKDCQAKCSSLTNCAFYIEHVNHLGCYFYSESAMSHFTNIDIVDANGFAWRPKMYIAFIKIKKHAQ